MLSHDALIAPPRVALLGEYRTPLGAASPGLRDALAAACDIRTFSVPHGARGWLPALSNAARALSREGCEMVHLLDPSLAPAALLLRARYRVPISVTLDGLRERRRPAPSFLGAIARFNQVFTSDLDHARDLVVQLRGPAIAHVPAGGTRLPEPPQRTLGQYRRAFRRAGPGRLTVAMPWPEDREHLRWFRDAVAPLLHGEPMCLLLSAPGTRDARYLFGGRAMKRLRVRTAALTAGEIAAAARFADVIVVPGAIRRVQAQSDALLALIESGVPVIAGGAVQDPMLQHERNALLIDPGDAMGLASTLNKLLMLPAQQRHYLGQDFAAHVADRTWEPAADIYAERFAAMVGRPRIPAQLKAA